MRPLRYRVLWAVLAWFPVVAIVVGSLASVPDLGGPRHSDKLVHVGAYAAAMIALSAAYLPARHFILGLVLASLGAAIEIVQPIVALRTASIADGVANLAGVAVGLALGRTEAVGSLFETIERLAGPGPRA